MVCTKQFQRFKGSYILKYNGPPYGTSFIVGLYSQL